MFGVTSWGDGCAYANQPGIYADVRSELNVGKQQRDHYPTIETFSGVQSWIESTTGGEC